MISQVKLSNFSEKLRSIKYYKHISFKFLKFIQRTEIPEYQKYRNHPRFGDVGAVVQGQRVEITTPNSLHLPQNQHFPT